MSFSNPFARRKDPSEPAPPSEEERRQRQENARAFFARVHQDPHSAPPPTDMPFVCSPAHDLLAPVPTPPLPATLDVGRELERAMQNGLFNGVVREIRREADAITQVGEQVQRKLDAQRKVVESNEQVLVAQNKLKATLFDGQIVEETKATELSRARLAKLQAERALREAVCSPSSPPPVPQLDAPSVRITDAQIEEEAVRLVVHLGNRDSAELDAYRPQLAATYPPLTVEEILRRARSIRGRRG